MACRIAEPIIPFIPERGGRRRRRWFSPAGFPSAHPFRPSPFQNCIWAKGENFLGQTRSGPFPAPVRRGSPIQTRQPGAAPPEAGCTHHSAAQPNPQPPWPDNHATRARTRSRLRGHRPLWGQGRLHPGSLRRHGPASLHGCGHSSMGAKRERTRSPARTPPNRKCAPAAAPRREEGQRSTTGGDWRESTGLVAPGTRSGLAGVVATRLRGVKTHQPFLREEQRRIREEPDPEPERRKHPGPRKKKGGSRSRSQAASAAGARAKRPAPAKGPSHRRAVNPKRYASRRRRGAGPSPGSGRVLWRRAAARLPPLIGPTHDHRPRTSRPKMFAIPPKSHLTHLNSIGGNKQWEILRTTRPLAFMTVF